MRILVFSLLCIFTSALHAEVRLPHIFSDNMVLQRDKSIKIWGWADRNETIEIRFINQVKKTKADRNGKWEILLDAVAYGGPYTMEVKGKNNQITLQNVLVGEVWLCSGQSNMEWPVKTSKDAAKEISDADYPLIRSFNVGRDKATQPEDDLDGSWQVCSPETVKDFSAVAYFFARKLNQELEIPIGIINSSWGGTDIETWTSTPTIENLPERFLQKYDKFRITNLDKFLTQNEINKKAYYNALKNDKGISEKWFDPSLNTTGWEKMEIPQVWEKAGLPNVDGIIWFRYNLTLPKGVDKATALLQLGTVDDADVTWVNGVKVGETGSYNANRAYKIDKDMLKEGINTITVKVTDHSGNGGICGQPDNMYLQIGDKRYPLVGEWLYKPAVTNKEFGYVDFSPNSYYSLLYNAMIAPITRFQIRGAIWYQGENNASQAYNYRTLFPTMIQDWRSQWGYEFPFYWVQLANFRAKDHVPTDSQWAELREAQSMTLSLPNTGQAVITDIGEANDIHPRNKQDVGLRLALIALNKDYGRKDVVYTGPTYKSMEITGNKAIISFDNVGSGLHINNKYGYIEGFAIAGADGKFEWAQAYIDKETENQIVVYSDKVINPIAVRYSWSNNPDVNLFNKEGLPAAPFRTDSWKGITEND